MGNHQQNVADVYISHFQISIRLKIHHMEPLLFQLSLQTQQFRRFATANVASKQLRGRFIR